VLGSNRIPDDERDKKFREVWKIVPDYTVQHVKRQSSQHSPTREPEISQQFSFSVNVQV
jgi:hypothetical protein